MLTMAVLGVVHRGGGEAVELCTCEVAPKRELPRLRQPLRTGDEAGVGARGSGVAAGQLKADILGHLVLSLRLSRVQQQQQQQSQWDHRHTLFGLTAAASTIWLC